MGVRPHLARSAAALVVGCVLLGSSPVAAAKGAPTDPDRTTRPGVYVVTLSAPPAAAYAGGVPGLPATTPTTAARFDRTRPAVRTYQRRLVARQDAVLRTIGRPAVLYRYTTALHGFAATLDSEQVRRLRATRGVLRVERSVRQRVDRALPSAEVAASSRSLLGVSGPDGAWARHGGPDRAGRGVVVGVVDSGIWPENPSFATLATRSPGADRAPAGFHGGCAAAERWSAESCNDKIVSARWFVKGFGEENTASAEYLSPRDGTGHGSHVASTAVGDHGVRVRVDDQRFGTTSGMAPAARLAVYKACWTAPNPDDDGCTTADTVAAVDAAVADGVDVLNYSVSGSRVLDDSVERALLGAVAAGVFVAASAGNDGPRAGSVGHVSPWVTTVGASTHHDFAGVVRLGDGRSYTGAMVADRRVPEARIVLGADVAAPGVSRVAARRCATGALDTAATQGRIVVCDRGGGPRVSKSASVAVSGGVAMVLANPRRQSTDADVHAVPTVHLDARQAASVKAYVRRAGTRATARLAPAPGAGRALPAVAGFSGRGPAPDRDVVKPDLTAPGVGILAAVAPPSDSGRSWDLASGTSTSAPHVAGLAAFVLGVRPRWTPAQVRSAMMTTAYDLAGRPGVFTEGAGHVDPSRFLDPGLVFDTPTTAWQRVLTGVSSLRDVNAPSVAVGDLVGPTTLTRRVTNVGRATESYAVRVVGLRGVDVQAFPATVRLAPGQSRTVRLRITARPTVPVDRDVTGWLVWRGDRHRVRVPVFVRPTVVAASEQVRGRGDAGTVVVRGRSGNGRTLKLRSTRLVAARTTAVRPSQGRFDPADHGAASVRVPAGTLVARIAAAGDVDLRVYRGGRRVAEATGDSPEVTLEAPARGSYQVHVHERSATDASPTVARLSTWLVPGGAGTRGPKVELSTDAVGFAPGRAFRYSASWKGLDPAQEYLGVVTYGDSDRRTLLEVDSR